ncbi:MAG: hypothetical protein ACKOSS_04445 [Planctomycetia bacterium]
MSAAATPEPTPDRTLAAPPPAGEGWGKATGLALLAALVAFVAGRMLGASGERAQREAEASDLRRQADLAEQLARKQDQLVGQLQQLLTVTEQAAEARVKVAEGLRESVELASTLLLMESREGLAPLGRLEIVERAARVALEPYEARDLDSLAPASLEVKWAATALLGDVQVEQGRLAEAADTLRQALSLARLRQQARPQVARQLAVARAHETLADALERGADLSGALAEREEGLRVVRELAQAQPAELAWQGEAVEVQARIAGTLRRLARDERALATAREAGEARWLPVLARALGALAPCLARAGQGGEALSAWDEAITLLDPGAGAPPPGTEALALRADFLLARGEHDLAGDRAPAAVATLRMALDVAVDVVAREPLARAGQERLAHVCTRLAEALEAGGEPEDALRGRLEAVLAWRRVSELDPARDEPRHAWLDALLALGDLQARQSDLQGALASYEQARTLVQGLEPEAEAAPAPGRALRMVTGSDLATCHDRVAATLLALGRRADALEAWRASLAVIEPLAKKTPENAFWQADLACIWMHLGEAQAAVEAEREEGARSLRRALRLLAPLEEGARLPAYASAWPGLLRARLEGLPR